MCRLVRISFATLAIFVLIAPAHGQAWNPFAKEPAEQINSPQQANQVTQPSPSSQPQQFSSQINPFENPAPRLTEKQPPSGFSALNPFASPPQIDLNKMLPFPGLTQPDKRPLNQPSISERFQVTTSKMWADTKRAITTPILQNRPSRSGPTWPFQKTKMSGLSMPKIFKTSAPAPQGPPPTLQEWLAQPRPE